MRRSDATDPAPVDPAPPPAAGRGEPEVGRGEPEAGQGEPEELLVEEISIDGMCGVY